ncbi:hypothetical protein IFY68_01833 [Klebsiella pneumoniae]|nr:hypothetical protein AOT21_05603 [Klebsiella pneumoniae]QRC79869.1 hypothetical protein IFY68_01833 [Klebsiella pneumoniae]SYK20956.1 Uncharacterised protein [Klebsiella pneumoniae]
MFHVMNMNNVLNSIMMKNKNKLRSAPRNQRQVKFIVSQVV